MIAPMHRTSLSASVMLFVAFTSTSGAQMPDPFAEVPDSDPMELARVVDRMGDAAVLERLGPEADSVTRIGAIRAAPFMTGPELALETLAEIAAGRHPHLAPAAAQSATTIVRQLDADSLARREQLPVTLAGAAARFDAIAQDEAVRPDLRTVGSIVAAQLYALGVPASQ